MKNSIPNLITLANLSSGCIGVVFAFTTDLRMVSIMIFISLILDYLDGTAARLLNAHSPLGKELDSLADLVSFGLLPGLIAYQLLHSSPYSNWAYVAFLLTVFSAYRLAKFNIDERQSVNFIGLPTPANALFWSAFPLVIFGDNTGTLETSMAEYMWNPTLIILFIFLFSYLLIAELPLFSLKFKNFKWKENSHRFIFLILTLILFLTIRLHSIPFILILYVLISLLQNKKSAI